MVKSRTLVAGGVGAVALAGVGYLAVTRGSANEGVQTHGESAHDDTVPTDSDVSSNESDITSIQDSLSQGVTPDTHGDGSHDGTVPSSQDVQDVQSDVNTVQSNVDDVDQQVQNIVTQLQEGVKPQTHGDEAHEENYASDNHGNEAHSQDFLTGQHGDGAHSTDYATGSELSTTEENLQGSIDALEQFFKETEFGIVVDESMDGAFSNWNNTYPLSAVGEPTEQKADGFDGAFSNWNSTYPLSAVGEPTTQITEDFSSATA